MPLSERKKLPIITVLERDNADFCVVAAKRLLFEDSRVQEGAFAGGLYLVNEDKLEFDLQFEWNLKDAFVEDTYSLPVNGAAASLFLNEVPAYLGSGDIMPDALEYQRRKQGYEGVAILPLISQNAVFGAMVAYINDAADLDQFLRSWLEFLVGNIVRCFEGCRGSSLN